MLPWLKRLKPSGRSRIVRPAGFSRPSTNSETSWVPVPWNADLENTVPAATGRSLLAPSPLLSMPVMELKGRADASCVTVPAVEHESRRAPAAGSGDEVGGVDEQIAGALALAERGVEQRQRRNLAAENRRL